MNSEFIHLNLHTEFSLIDSTVRIKKLIQTCAEQNMPAIALTDHMNLFALVKFYRAALQQGIKPIIGAEIAMENPKDKKQPFLAILLCKNNIGYQNLIKLISHAYLEGQTTTGVLIDRKWVVEMAEGLIMLSGAQNGDVGQLISAGKFAAAEKCLQRWNDVFPDSYYLELQRCNRENENFYIQNVLQLAENNGVPVVATNPIRFLVQDDFTAHETRVAIHDGYILTDSRRPKNYTHQQYFRSTDEMKALFQDIPSALENTVEIAKRCNFELSLGNVFLPNFPIAKDMTEEEYFRKVSEQGLQKRWRTISPDNNAEKQTLYQQRLQLELDVIIQMGFPGYFLIVADFIQWAKSNDVPVGPGRGSGAGSLVAYSLDITDVDPIEHGLLFERFLNPERVSMPDFDIDFCMQGRDKVIEYVAETYGRDAVSQIITYGTMAAKAVVRDVGRVLGHPYGFVDKLAKMIPFTLGITLSEALKEETLQQRYQKEDEVRALFDLALKLEGLTRNVGKHAGGVVIAPSALTDFTPIYMESEEGSLVSQFDKDDVEAIGLVKFDFLGLRTLTIIDWALKAINQKLKKNQGSELDIATISLNNKETFDLLKTGNTTAIFQLESRGMKELIGKLQPDCFEDIVALMALFRPGPLQSGMVDDFIARKHGRSKVEYPHPALADILKETYGIILYQEQVMQIAQILAGYTLGEADILRRAMGKKKPEEMAKQRAVFMQGAIENGVDGKVATSIFDMMEKFAAYGFNKSHSVAYALLSYQTAWLKRHYPAEFMAAVLSSDMDNTDKIVVFFDDAKDFGLQILAPDINSSHYKFTADEQGRILYGLGAIKGVGEAALDAILEARKQDGLFQNLFEFCQRIDLRKANRRVLEALIKSGALDCFAQDRAILFASLEKALKSAEQAARNKDIGQADLFGGVASAVTEPEYLQVEPWTEKQRLETEKESLGLYLSGHPLHAYKSELDQLTSCKIKDFATKRSGILKIAGIITSMRTMNTRSGGRMAIVNLDDLSGRTDVPIFPEMYQNHYELLVKDNIIIIEGEVQQDRFTGGYRFTTSNIVNLEQARTLYSKGILLSLQNDTEIKIKINQLRTILEPFIGGCCDVLIDYRRDDACARLNLGQDWRVTPNDKLLDELRHLIGPEQVQVLYTHRTSKCEMFDYQS